MSVSTDNYLSRERAALEQRIEMLTRTCHQLQEQVDYLSRFEKGGKLWLRMQKHIMEKEQIRDAWFEFYAMYRLYITDIEELK